MTHNLLLALGVLVVALIAPAPISEIEHAYYFPVVREGCAMSPEKGIAWAHRTGYTRTLCSRYYYNSTSHNQVGDHPGAVAIIRPNFPVPDTEVVERLQDEGEIYLIALNEPGLEEIPPGEAARWVDWVRSELPDAILVGPNVLGGEQGTLWYNDYINAGGRPFDILGVHIYRESGCSPSECIDALCAIHGECERVWITEIGADNRGVEGAATLSSWLEEIEVDGRVTRTFAYTAINGCCGKRLDLIRQDGELFDTGEVWRVWR